MINSNSISCRCKNTWQILGCGTTLLIKSNDEMEDIMEIVTFLEDSDLLIKGVSETIQNKAKEQKWGFLSML